MLVWLGLGLTFFADDGRSSPTVPSRPKTCCARSTSTGWRSRSSSTGRCSGWSGWVRYVPYLALLAILHATVALLVYALVRRRTLPWVAVGITLIVLLFGSGFENLFWGAQIGFVGATAMGLGALLLLDDVPTLPGRAGRRPRRGS